MLFDLSVLVAITIALVQVVKSMIDMPAKYQPIASVVIGLLITFLGTKLDYVSVEIFRGIAMNGLLVGLMAAGLYDQKALITK